jgi:hypothetical protein
LHAGRHSLGDEPAFRKYDVNFRTGEMVIILFELHVDNYEKCFIRIFVRCASFAVLGEYYPT